MKVGKLEITPLYLSIASIFVLSFGVATFSIGDGICTLGGGTLIIAGIWAIDRAL